MMNNTTVNFTNKNDFSMSRVIGIGNILLLKDKTISIRGLLHHDEFRKFVFVLNFSRSLIINFVSRCPPPSPAPGQNCYTLPDASDPCCNITVCDKPVPDPDQNVQKESVNVEPKQPRVINEFELTSGD